MQPPLIIEAQFRGPPDSGNGGYVAGAIAQRLSDLAPSTPDGIAEKAVEVTLRAPIPLDAPLEVLKTGPDQLRVTRGETLIAEARRTELEIAIPSPPSFSDALDAQSSSPAFTDNINPLVPNGRGFHPICFCCGADVPANEGLHVYAAPVEGFHGVAAAWRPSAARADSEGMLNSAALWAALDCPGQFAYFAEGILTGLLGRITARILRPVEVEQNTVITGWCISIERSKHFAGTALFNESGNLCAYTKQVWIGRRETS